MNINLKTMSAFNRLEQPKDSVYLKKESVTTTQKYYKFILKQQKRVFKK